VNSLHLACIRRSDKDLLLPKVVFTSVTEAQGYYYRPREEEVFLEGHYYSGKRGIIEVSKSACSTADTLVHEWRHHWQWFNCPAPRVVGFDCTIPYREAIIKFFKSSWNELDALRFAYKFAPTEVTEMWIEWLVKERLLRAKHKPFVHLFEIRGERESL
jgi:hypothetical protein